MHLGLILLVGILFTTTAFVLYQLETDPLQYFLIAKHIAATGNPNASLAENLPQFVYASGTSYVYAPIMLIFHTFAFRIHAIQCLNIGLVCVFFGLAIRYFRAAAPFANLSLVSAFFGLAILTEARWQQAMMVPNSDIVPAIFTVFSSLVGCDEKAPFWRKMGILLGVGAIGFLVKLSLGVIPIIFLIVELANRRLQGKRLSIGVCVATVVCAVALVIVELHTAELYIHNLLRNSRNPLAGVPPDQMLHSIVLDVENFFFSAMPGAIVPNLRYIFLDDIHYGSTAFDPSRVSFSSAVGLIVGWTISFLIVAGSHKLGRKRPCDVALAAACISAFFLVSNSTDRYLMGFWPFLWACFMHGAQPVVGFIRSNREKFMLLVVAATCVLLTVEVRSVGLRARQLAGIVQLGIYRKHLSGLWKRFGLPLTTATA